MRVIRSNGNVYRERVGLNFDYSGVQEPDFLVDFTYRRTVVVTSHIWFAVGRSL